MKKYFLLGIFSLMSIVSLFAQQSERITYQEGRPSDGPDGINIRDVTVNAVLLGWEQQWHYLDGDFKVTMSSFCPYNGEWLNWKLAERSPAMLPNILSIYTVMRLGLFQYPRLGVKFYYNGQEVIKMPAIPNGKSSPIWWNEDGRSFYMFYKYYKIL